MNMAGTLDPIGPSPPYWGICSPLDTPQGLGRGYVVRMTGRLRLPQPGPAHSRELVA